MAAYQRKLHILPLPETPERVLGCYWIPSKPFLDEIASYLQGKKVLEIFAGNGYLAAWLTHLGVEVTSTTRFSGHDSHDSGMYFPVQEMEAQIAVSKFAHDHDVLLLCWPTVTIEVLHAALLWGVRRPIVFIGEFTDYTVNQLGGCATDEFWELFEFEKKFLTYEARGWEAAGVLRISELSSPP
jgi:hypothetical protein